jgi:triosephosphate isomerase
MINKKVVANWKMSADLSLVEQLTAELKRALFHFDTDLILCPSFVHIPLVRAKLKHNRDIKYGAQDVSAHPAGAHTGEVSAAMLQELGCSYVIIGHSERRRDHQENDALIIEKVKRALEHRLVPIICVGESLGQREVGITEDILHAQLEPILQHLSEDAEFMIAYEPIWAIGTGRSAALDDILNTHCVLREKLHNYVNAKVLYGGSVNAENALDIVGTPGVDGLLVGGASLKAEELTTICRAAHQYSYNDQYF